MLLFWQEPGRAGRKQLFGRLHDVFLLFIRVGGWQVRTPIRDLHIDLLSVPLLSREWCTLHIDGHLCVNSFSWPMSFDTYSLLWKVGDLELLYTSGVEGKMSMIKPAQTLNIERVASA